MSGPYSQEQYERAKGALSSGAIPQDKVPVVQQRLSQYEDDRARGYLPAPTMKAPQPSVLKREGGAAPAFTDPSQFAEQRAAVDWKKLTRLDDSTPTASKLKALNTPPDYDPPKLPGSILSGLAGLKPTTRYFEPTAREFRQVVAAEPSVAAKLLKEYPKAELDRLPDESLTNSDAFKIYSDARWQHAMGEAMKTRTPIKRVAYTETDWMGGGQGEVDPKTGQRGPRKLSLADAMDASSAVGTGMLQGASLGLYDTALTALGATDMRDDGRGSRDRYPHFALGGELYGGLSKHGAPGKLAKGLSGLGRPGSLAGRVTKGAAVGAGMAVLDQNIRAAAKLAADAIDAEDTAVQGLQRIAGGLPGVQPTTVGIGAGLGAGADLVGAGAGALADKAPGWLGIKAPLQHLEASGGKVGIMGGPKPSPEAQAWADKGASARTTAQDLISEEAVQPMARQLLKEQEAARRAGELETNVAQAGLEGVELPTRDAAAAIRADAHNSRPITELAQRQQKQLLDIADRLSKSRGVGVTELDDYIQQLDDAAGQGKANREPVEHLNNASKRLRELRDQFAGREAPAETELPEPVGLLDAPDPIGEPVMASPLKVAPRPSKEMLAAHREAVAQAAQNVTPEEREAVRKFTRGYDESIRKMQRGTADEEIAAGHKRGAEHAAEARAAIPHLESYMAKMPAATEVPYVYRGVVLSPEEAQQLLKSQVVHADPVGQAAITSVSADPVVGRSFVARNLEPGKVGVLFKFKHKTAVGTAGSADAQMAVEKELLLRGNAKFRVTKRYEDASNPGQYIIEAEEVAPEGKRLVAGIRDAQGNVTPTEGYAALKSKQANEMAEQEMQAARILGNDKPRKLSAKPVTAEMGPSKGLFNTETPGDVVSKLEPDVDLSPGEHKALKQNIRGLAKADNKAVADETLGLAKRVGPELEKKLRIIQQLDDADALASALGRSISGISARGGHVGAFLDRKQLFRAVPTLKNLSGGLPSKPTPSSEASDWSVNRLKQFIAQFPDRLPKAAKAGVEGFKQGRKAKDPGQVTFMPQLPSMNLRAGLPVRVVGAARDKQDTSETKFSQEEADFWLKVIDTLAKEKPQ